MLSPKTILAEERAPRLLPLFGDLWIPPVIHAALYGEMGFACVDRVDAPSVCSLNLSDFVMFAGDATTATARYFVDTTERPCFVLPSGDAWEELLRERFGDVTTRRRYSFRKGGLGREHLSATAIPPAAFELRPLDGTAVRQAAAEAWSQSLVENFPSVELFLSTGVGYGIFEHGRLVAGASSFTVYRNFLEVEVDTHPDYRRRGLATVVAARLLLHCLDHGLVPHWDAANETSRSIAERLGFTLDRGYEVLEV